jgi:hypothetical protein
VLDLPEAGHHDEVLTSVVAHNARRRAKRRRAARNRRFAEIGSKLAFVVACSIGVGVFAVVLSNLLGGGQRAAHTGTTASLSAAAAAAAAAVHPTPAKTVKHHVVQTASKVEVKASTKAKAKTRAKTKAKKQPVTASIASISPKHHTTAKTKPKKAATKKKPTHTASPGATQAVVLAESDASKGTAATSLEATIPDPSVATFTIAATRGQAFVEVRLKTSSGPLLTKGIVPKGETITFSNKALWVKVYAPGRLDLSVNGRPWRPTGSTVVATLTPTGAHR